MNRNFEDNIVLTTQYPQAFLVFTTDSSTEVYIDVSAGDAAGKILINGWDISKKATGSNFSINAFDENPAPFMIYTDNKETFDLNLSFIFYSSIILESSLYIEQVDISIYNRPTIFNSNNINNYSTYTPLVDDKASYLLLRTIPTYSGNIKLVVDSSNNLYLDTFKVSDTLSDKKYRKQQISSKSVLSGDIRKVFSSIPRGEIFNISNEDILNVSSSKIDLRDQYNMTYTYGARLLKDELYDDDYSILAPLWINTTIPSYFTIFRLDGIYNKETYENDPDLSSLAIDFIKSGQIIKSWNLKDNSKIGEYLNNHLHELNNIEAPVKLSLRDEDPNTWYGIAVDTGIIAGRSEYPNEFEQKTHNFSDINSFVSHGFIRNNLLCPNIINMEFTFNDNEVEEYSMHRYFGLYLTENELYKIAYYSDTIDGSVRILSLDGKDNNVFIDSSTIFSSLTGNVRQAYTNRLFVLNDGENLNRISNVANINGDRTHIDKYVNKLGNNIFTTEVKKINLKSFITFKVNNRLNQGDHLRIINKTQNKIWEIYGTDSSIYNDLYVSFNEPGIGYPTLYRTSFSTLGTIADQLTSIKDAFDKFKDYEDSQFSTGIKKDSTLSISIDNEDDDFLFQRIMSSTLADPSDPNSKFSASANYDDITFYGIITPSASDYTQISFDASFGPIDFELFGDRLSITLNIINTLNYNVYSFDSSIVDDFSDFMLYQSTNGYNYLNKEFDISTNINYKSKYVLDPTSISNKSIIITEHPLALIKNKWNAYDTFPLSISLMGINPVKDFDTTVYDSKSSGMDFKSDYWYKRENDASTYEFFLPALTSYTIPNHKSEYVILSGTGLISVKEEQYANPTIIYGYLYNWYVTQEQITYAEWKVPDVSDWQTLTDYYIASSPAIDASNISNHLKGLSVEPDDHPRWDFDSSEIPLDTFNFNAYPGGYREYNISLFLEMGQTGVWWCYNEYTSAWAYRFRMSYDSGLVLADYSTYDEWWPKECGQSIRLVRDASTDELSLSDGSYTEDYIGNDGKVYKAVKIGTQVWLAENLAETKYADGSNISKVTGASEWVSLTTAAYCAYENDENYAVIFPDPSIVYTTTNELYNAQDSSIFYFNNYFNEITVNTYTNTRIAYNDLDGSFNYTSYNNNISEENINDYYINEDKEKLKYGLIVPTVSKWGANGTDCRGNRVRLNLTADFFEDSSTTNTNFLPFSSYFSGEISYPVFKYMDPGKRNWKEYIYYDIYDIIEFNGELKTLKELMIEEPSIDIFSKIVYSNYNIDERVNRSSILYYNSYNEKLTTVCKGLKLSFKINDVARKVFNTKKWNRYRFSFISTPSINRENLQPIEVFINEVNKTILMVWYQGNDILNYSKRFSETTYGKNSLFDIMETNNLNYYGISTNDASYSYIKAPYRINTSRVIPFISDLYAKEPLYDSSVSNNFTQFNYNTQDNINSVFIAPGENFVSNSLLFNFSKSLDTFNQREVNPTYAPNGISYGTNIVNYPFSYFNNFNFYADKTCDLSHLSEIIKLNYIQYYIISEEQTLINSNFSVTPIIMNINSPVVYKSNNSDSSIYTFNGSYRPMFNDILNFSSNENYEFMNIVKRDFIMSNTNLVSYNNIPQYWFYKVLDKPSTISNNIAFTKDFSPFKSSWDSNYYNIYDEALNFKEYANGYESNEEIPSFFGSKLISLPDQLILNEWTLNNTSITTLTSDYILEYNITATIIDFFKNKTRFIENWSTIPNVDDSNINEYIIKTILDYYNISLSKLLVDVKYKQSSSNILSLIGGDTFNKTMKNISSQLIYENNEYIYKIKVPISENKSYYTIITFNKK